MTNLQILLLLLNLLLMYIMKGNVTFHLEYSENKDKYFSHPISWILCSRQTAAQVIFCRSVHLPFCPLFTLWLALPLSYLSLPLLSLSLSLYIYLYICIYIYIFFSYSFSQPGVVIMDKKGIISMECIPQRKLNKKVAAMFDLEHHMCFLWVEGNIKLVQNWTNKLEQNQFIIFFWNRSIQSVHSRPLICRMVKILGKFSGVFIIWSPPILPPLFCLLGAFY